MALRNPTGRANYEPNSWGGEIGGPREDPRARLPIVTRRRRAGRSGGCGRRRFADHYSQARQFYVSQTDGRAEAHRRRLRLRAEQGRDARHPCAHGRQPAQRRRGPRAARSPTASASTRCREPRRRRARRSPTCRPRRRSASSATARQTSPGASSASWSPTAPTPALLAALQDGGRRPKARWSSSSRPTVGGVDAQRRQRVPGAAEDRRRPVGALRRRRRPRLGRRRGAAGRRGGREGLRHRRLRARQVHRLRRGGEAAVREGRA